MGSKEDVVARIKDDSASLIQSSIEICQQNLTYDELEQRGERLIQQGKELNEYLKEKTLYFQETCMESDLNDKLARRSTLLAYTIQHLVKTAKKVKRGQKDSSKLEEAKQQIAQEVHIVIDFAQHVFGNA